MAANSRAPRIGRTKCYFHEMQRPQELAYDRFQYHICFTCQSRLLELAKADFQFSLRDQVIAISIPSRVRKETAQSESY